MLFVLSETANTDNMFVAAGFGVKQLNALGIKASFLVIIRDERNKREESCHFGEDNNRECNRVLSFFLWFCSLLIKPVPNTEMGTGTALIHVTLAPQSSEHL